MDQPPDHDQERSEGQEAEVPAERCAQVVAEVVYAEELVVDQPLDDVKIPHPARTRPRWKRQLGARRPRCQAEIPVRDAARRSSQVATWKKPSARTLASSPASVFVG